MSTLAAALEKPPADTRRKCAVNRWLATLSKADRVAAEAAFVDANWGTVALFRVFAEQGYPWQVTTVSKHRSGACACR